ncbi:MAG TPA: hypothetical protein DCE41_34605 [Cytophagales bacterium]|nr:hypothetical protein [Cytophagales bacterium]HAA22952.1 hypothetical protein [Cytophagales bacterium]HAP60182.1 hypothetical protein [Cytophagales bacterium]
MEVDHIFIFSDREGAEADELVSMGFREGSSRIHPGQGTRNRKFYFENFFLEILWVHDLQEVKSQRVQPTHLWEHSQFATNGASPYGLCLKNQTATDILFKEAIPYYPEYLAEGTAIDFYPDTAPFLFPATFRLPIPGKVPSPTRSEPTDHQGQMKQLSQVQFTVPMPYAELKKQPFAKHFQDIPNISFVGGADHQLTLTFDRGKQAREIYLPTLKLAMNY